MPVVAIAALVLAQAVQPLQAPAGSTLREPLPAPAPLPPPDGPVLSLAEALEAARGQAPDLVVALERVRQSEIQIQRAYAALQPTLTGNASYTHSSVPNAVFGPTGIQETGHGSKAASLRFLWTLFNGRAFPAIATAYQQVDVARLSEAQARTELLLQVATAYISGATQLELANTAFRQARATFEHAREAQIRYEAGLVQQSAALRARIDALKADAEARRAVFAYRGAKSQLAALLDRRDAAFELVPPPETPAVVRGTFRELIERALRDRPEVAAARANEEIAARLRTDAWAQFLPSLSVDANARFNDPATSFTGDRGTWSVALALTLPLYDGGFRYAALKDAASQTRQARAQSRAQIARVEDEVRRAQLDLDSARALREEAVQQLGVARENERLVRAQFSAGTASQVEVSDAESALFQSEAQALEQRLAVQLSALRLAKAVGAFELPEDGR